MQLPPRKQLSINNMCTKPLIIRHQPHNKWDIGDPLPTTTKHPPATATLAPL